MAVTLFIPSPFMLNVKRVSKLHEEINKTHPLSSQQHNHRVDQITSSPDLQEQEKVPFVELDEKLYSIIRQ